MLTVSNPKTFNWRDIPLEDCCEGNAMDTHYTHRLYYDLMEQLEQKNNPRLMKLLEHVIMPALEEFSMMEYLGLDVSPTILEEVGKDLYNKDMVKEDELYSFRQVEKTDSLASLDNLQKVLYTREGGFELYPPIVTGKYV